MTKLQIQIVRSNIFNFLRQRRRLLLATLAVALSGPLCIAGLAYANISPNEAYVLDADAAQTVRNADVKVGLVLGAGVTEDGRPYRELQSRLDTAASALARGYVDKLVLSGDNRFETYNEPAAMKRYLIEERGIDAGRLQEDFGGRSTYESCERASKVFSLDKVIIISAGSHLPRAIYLCRHFGVEAYGLASKAEANNASRREVMARAKAMINVYVNGENTLLGEPIPLD